ncbi:helix-turn-helix domain-containing protein [Achromobacter anxifer]|uniref:helix-turn-helix domain-containing protein n=1 Tax=Achromobacter anxifer TaxID=1287737 RepID=UPI0023F68AA9|nr:helix-turn-helix domain-containing protein [Achromobacter anxifer]MDF8360180.1 helix-turn-helix domain-containing protein [Achromobacter anxifer]
MSVQAMTWALSQRIVTEASARHVLLCLANYAGSKGEGAFPSVATLAEDTGLSTRTVQAKLRELEAMQVIQRGNQDLVAAYIRRADQRPVCYDIDLSRGEPAAPRVEHSEDQERGEVAAPRDERGANDDATGCSSRRHGVKLTTSRGAAAAPEPSLNHQGTINKPKGARKRSPGFDPMTLELPGWMDTELWGRWVRHRVQIRKPLTEEAAKQQVKDLAGFRQQGHTPEAVIANAIGKSWQGLFAPGGQVTGPSGRSGKFNPTQYVNRNRAQGGNDYDDGHTIDA